MAKIHAHTQEPYSTPAYAITGAVPKAASNDAGTRKQWDALRAVLEPPFASVDTLAQRPISRVGLTDHPVAQMAVKLTGSDVVFGTTADRYSRKPGHLRGLSDLHRGECWTLLTEASVLAAAVGWGEKNSIPSEPGTPPLLQVAMGEEATARLDPALVDAFNRRTAHALLNAVRQRTPCRAIFCPLNLTLHVRTPESVVAKALLSNEARDGDFTCTYASSFTTAFVHGTEVQALRAIAAMTAASKVPGTSREQQLQAVCVVFVPIHVPTPTGVQGANHLCLQEYPGAEADVVVYDVGRQPWNCDHSGCKDGELQPDCECDCSSGCNDARCSLCVCQGQCPTVFCPCLCKRAEGDKGCTNRRKDTTAPTDAGNPTAAGPTVEAVTCSKCGERTTKHMGGVCGKCRHKGSAEEAAQRFCEHCQALMPAKYVERHPHHCSLECFLRNPHMDACTLCAEGRVYPTTKIKHCFKCKRKVYNKTANDKRAA